MSPDAIMPAAIDKVTQSTFRDRLSVNERLTVSMLAAGILTSAFTTMQDRLSIQTQCDASLSPADESEKRVRSAAVRLLVRHRL